MAQDNPILNYPFVSVIILNNNGLRYLNDCLSSLNRIDYSEGRFEIIMVDNGSRDGSVAFVSEKFPSVRIIRLTENAGYSRGNNIGIEHARYEYIVFLNNDTIVDTNWLKELVSPLLRGEAQIANSKVVYFHNRDILNIGRGHINRWGSGFCRGAGEEHRLYNENIFVHHATGCSMIVKKDDFEKIGKFDEDFFAYHEDIDFGWRAWILGYKIRYAPTSLVYHKSGGTAGAFSPYKMHLLTRNTLFYIIKNCESRYLFSMALLNLLFNLALALVFLSPLKPRSLAYKKSIKISLAIFTGQVDFIRKIPLYINKRRDIQAKRIVSDKRLMKIGVILTFRESVAYLVKNNFKTVNHLIESEKQKKKEDDETVKEMASDIRRDLYSHYGKNLSAMQMIYARLRLEVVPIDKYSKWLGGGGKILSMGCGYGLVEYYLAREIPRRYMLGIDKNTRRIEIARNSSRHLKNLDYKCLDIRQAQEIGTAEWDAIMANDLFHHIDFESQKALMRNIGLLLKRGGVLIIKDIDPTLGPRRLFNTCYDKLFNRASELYYRKIDDYRRLMDDNSLKLNAVERYNKFLFAHFIMVGRKV